MPHGASFGVPGVDTESVLRGLENQQQIHNFISINGKAVSDLRKKYTGVGWTDLELEQMATGEFQGAIDEYVRYVSFEPYYQMYNSFGSPGNIHENVKNNEFIQYMLTMQAEFKSPSAYGQWLGGADEVVENIDDINDYLSAIGEPPLAQSRDKAAAEGDINRWDKYQRSYGHLSRSGPQGFTAEEGQMLLTNIDLYNQWDTAFQKSGLPTPTMDEVREAAEEFDTPLNMSDTLTARGKAEELSDAARSFFESAGFGREQITSAYKQGSGEFFKQIQAFADMNPIYKRRAGISAEGNIEDIDTLNDLIRDYGNSTNLQAWYNAEDFASSVGQKELTSLQPFGLNISEKQLAEGSFAGEKQSLQSRIVEARERKKAAFTQSETARGGGGRQQGDDFDLADLFG